MKMMNSIRIEGRVVPQLVIRFDDAGQSVLRFTLQHEGVFRHNAKWVKQESNFSVDVRDSDRVAPGLKVGDLVRVCGRIDEVPIFGKVRIFAETVDVLQQEEKQGGENEIVEP